MSVLKTAGPGMIARSDAGIATQILWITAGAAATAIAAQIEIPHTPVPYTLQTLVVLLTAGILGWRNGGLSQLLYLSLGAAGLPMFSGLGGGIARLIGPTGGYLLAFPVAAIAAGYLIQNSKSTLVILSAMLTGLLIIFSLGTLQLYIVYYHDWGLAFSNGFLIFSWWDILKVVAATAIVREVSRR